MKRRENITQQGPKYTINKTLASTLTNKQKKTQHNHCLPHTETTKRQGTDGNMQPVYICEQNYQLRRINWGWRISNLI